MARSILSKKILENIQYDKWVPASKIAAKLGVRSHRIGITISTELLNIDVERKPMRRKQSSPYLYRRILRVGMRS